MIFRPKPDWVPEEVSGYREWVERYRTSTIAFAFSVELSAEQAETLGRWEDAQRRLWDAALKRGKRSSAPTWETVERDAREQQRWLTVSRAKHSFLKEVPRSFQDGLLSQLNGALKHHYFFRGSAPEPWRATTETYPLLRVSGSHVRVLTDNHLRLPKLGAVQLVGETPVTENSAVARVHVARGPLGEWRALLYVYEQPERSATE